MAAARPLLTARPGRFSTWRALPARVVLTMLALACLALGLASIGKPVEPAPLNGRMTDLALYDGIAAGVRGGGPYYNVAADALRAGGYPLRPFLAFRLPTLSLIEAWLPLSVLSALLAALVIAVAVAWGLRLREAIDRPVPIALALILLAGGMLTALEPDLSGFHEIWAGLLIALSLALRAPGRWVDSVAFGLAAMLFRETAAAYVVLMAALAWAEGERREALGWGIALALFGAVLGAHAWAVGRVTGPLDPASPGWLGLNGPVFASGAVVSTGALRLFPDWAAVPLALLALFGWSGWRHPTAVRAGLMLLGYGVMLAVFARADTFYWALLIAPLSLLGLIFVPDALRELIRAALDRRAVTVTKVTR